MESIIAAISIRSVTSALVAPKFFRSIHLSYNTAVFAKSPEWHGGRAPKRDCFPVREKAFLPRMVKEAYDLRFRPWPPVGRVPDSSGWNWAAGVLIFLGLFVFYFFRDPERAIPSDPGAVVSPADGHIVVDRGRGARFGGGAAHQHFPFDLGRARAACAGGRAHAGAWSTSRGSFTRRCAPRASEKNEQNVIYIDTPRRPRWSSNKSPERSRGACYAGNARAKRWLAANGWA